MGEIEGQWCRREGTQTPAQDECRRQGETVGCGEETVEGSQSSRQEQVVKRRRLMETLDWLADTSESGDAEAAKLIALDGPDLEMGWRGCRCNVNS